MAPLSNDTIDSVLRHREEGRAKDLSAPHRNNIKSFQLTDNALMLHESGYSVM